MGDAYAGLPVLDLTAPDWWREPAVTTASMHDRGAVAAFVPSFGTVMFLRYDDCHAGLTNPSLTARGPLLRDAGLDHEGALWTGSGSTS